MHLRSQVPPQKHKLKTRRLCTKFKTFRAKDAGQMILDSLKILMRPALNPTTLRKKHSGSAPTAAAIQQQRNVKKHTSRSKARLSMAQAKLNCPLSLVNRVKFKQAT